MPQMAARRGTVRRPLRPEKGKARGMSHEVEIRNRGESLSAWPASADRLVRWRIPKRAQLGATGPDPVQRTKTSARPLPKSCSRTKRATAAAILAPPFAEGSIGLA